MAWPPSTIFSQISHKRYDFRKKKLLNTKYVFCFPLQLLSETFLILWRTEWGMIKKMCTGHHAKYPFLLSDSNETRSFSADFREILKYQISWQSVLWEPSSSMRTDGQTWRIVAFRSFSKAPKHWVTITYLAWTQTGYYSVTAPLTCSVILLNTLKDLESLLCPATWRWKQDHLPKRFSKRMGWWTMSKKSANKDHYKIATNYH